MKTFILISKRKIQIFSIQISALDYSFFSFSLYTAVSISVGFPSLSEGYMGFSSDLKNLLLGIEMKGERNPGLGI